MSESTPSTKSKPQVIPGKFFIPFCLVTTLFALWGFANDITNPLVKAFKDVFVISNTQSSFVQLAFYGGYATMALPAAVFIRRYGYKSGIIVGLALYATGAMMSFPAASLANFNLFLVALYILTFGLAFLETTANPYILAMGPEETATRRLNFAQAFNPIGSLTGMSVAIFFILSSLQVQDFRNDVQRFRDQRAAEFRVTDESAASQGAIVSSLMNALRLEPSDKDAPVDPPLRQWLETKEASRNEPVDAETLFAVRTHKQSLDPETASLVDIPYDSVLTPALVAFKGGEIATFRDQTHADLQAHDLQVVRTPYVVIGLIVMGVMLVFIFSRMPHTVGERDRSLKLGPVFKRLVTNKRYVEGVVAQAVYVGAQIMCWTFIIHYATDLLGFTFARAQLYNVCAMVIFCSSRFICTYLLKYVSPGKLLMVLSVGGILTTLGAIFLPGMIGLYSLVGISACMSLMFPTIYGIALDGLGEDAKIASAGLIFAIVGGALMPPMQGRIIDMGEVFGMTAVRASFFLPMLCFVFIAIYGYRTVTIHHEHGEMAVR